MVIKRIFASPRPTARARPTNRSVFGISGPRDPRARPGGDRTRGGSPSPERSCPPAKERPEIERALWAPPKTLDTRNYPHTTPYSWAQPPQPLSAACAGTARRGRADPDAPGRRGGGTDIGLCAHAMHAKVKTQNTPVVLTRGTTPAKGKNGDTRRTCLDCGEREKRTSPLSGGRG